MKDAHVICCNDMVMHVHVGDADDAERKLEVLANEDYLRQQEDWEDKARRSVLSKHWEDAYAYYRWRCSWHIRTVPCTES